jgi:hypothetical protein
MKVQALRDIAGGYGFCPEGGVMNITEAAAKELEAVGLVKIIGEAKDEPEIDSEAEKEKRAKKGSTVRIKDAK